MSESTTTYSTSSCLTPSHAHLVFFMATLCNRAGHYIFVCGFFLFSSFFRSPYVSGRRLDVYHTSTHGVALVRI